ncbi:response regulator transcription factor [Candidatus Pantoea multigeneris]|uniref:Response regulator n=1 Tax=Candidatus Pantoea multigeneris TaxID=2608357 RepID=A0ABX0R9R3_9GAMM|nr:response regulator [Pantoea multigeneris]NIF22117.1 response regulator [Pantoea multigeneris]
MQQVARIVIVDDDRAVRHGLSNLLAAEGYQPQLYDCGEALLADSAVLQDTALMLLDISLSGISGFELYRTLAEGDIPPPPVIFLSGHGGENMLWYAQHLGAITWLPKPIDVELLLSHIRQCIEAGEA